MGRSGPCVPSIGHSCFLAVTEDTRLGIVLTNRAAELYLSKTELIAKTVGGLGEPKQSSAAILVEEIELSGSVAKPGKRRAEKAHLPFRVPV